MAETRARRWYRLTPERFVLGLAAVEGLLLASERFRWFPFNVYKGWTVLVGVAAIGVAVPLVLLGLVASLLLGRRFQFSLRTLLLFTLVCAFVCSWLATAMRQAEKQREAVEAIGELGGGFNCGYQVQGQEPSGPPWLRATLGKEFFDEVASVVLDNTQVTDAGLEHLKELAEFSAELRETS